MNIVLLGQKGTGKSASGNTIMGKYMFLSETSFEAVTKECQVHERQTSNTLVKIIDTLTSLMKMLMNQLGRNRLTSAETSVRQGPVCTYW